MGLRISTNISALQGRRQLFKTSLAMDSATARLASGDRINKAADDAAGLSVSEGIKATIRSIRQANRNANDGISMVQVAEGGLNEVANIVTRLRELGIQAASDTVGDTERGFIQKEVNQLKNEIDRIALVTRWGATHLLDGTAQELDFQVGVFNDDFEDRITFDSSVNNARLESLDLADLNFAEKAGAQAGLEVLDDALVHVNEMRSNLGALDTRLHHSLANMLIYEENMSAAKMRIRDTDFAEASSDMVREQILHQAAIVTIAQANQSAGVALKLL
ncbi:MAG: flagellin FliC [Bdellovibrionaceae bacterium]|nr:flagellin FliC [Bdellovibrionales bacterium]MCB9083735.1 flagellin FliC [Pseudobdellovibrionaceae bacterium]